MPLEVHEVADDGFVVFRVVRVPTADDPMLVDSFKSNLALDRPPRGIENRSAVIQMGISVYDTQEAAMDTARLPRVWPKIGCYVAELRLVPDLGFGYTDQTGQPGHLTLWGRPAQLRQVVADIVPIPEP